MLKKMAPNQFGWFLAQLMKPEHTGAPKLPAAATSPSPPKIKGDKCTTPIISGNLCAGGTPSVLNKLNDNRSVEAIWVKHTALGYTIDEDGDHVLVCAKHGLIIDHWQSEKMGQFWAKCARHEKGMSVAECAGFFKGDVYTWITDNLKELATAAVARNAAEAAAAAAAATAAAAAAAAAAAGSTGSAAPTTPTRFVMELLRKAAAV